MGRPKTIVVRLTRPEAVRRLSAKQTFHAANQPLNLWCQKISRPATSKALGHERLAPLKGNATYFAAPFVARVMNSALAALTNSSGIGVLRTDLSSSASSLLRAINAGYT